MVSGFKEMALVGQASAHLEQPSGQREESIFGFPRKRSGKVAAATSGITGSPWARRTVTALGGRQLIGNETFGGASNKPSVAISASHRFAFVCVVLGPELGPNWQLLVAPIHLRPNR